MNRILAGGISALLTLAAGAWAQTPPPPPAQIMPPVLMPGSGAGAPPAYAFDIPKSDVDLLLKDHPGGDKQIRVVDMGKYNMGIGIIYRGPTHDKPGDPIHVLYHDFTAETYIIQSGSGILTTGGVIEQRRQGGSVPNVMNGPGGSGIAGRGAYSRRVEAGDIIIIPTGVAHGWSQITDHVTYLSVRPDPDRVLPAGWVYPSLLKQLPDEVKIATPATTATRSQQPGAR